MPPWARAGSPSGRPYVRGGNPMLARAALSILVASMLARTAAAEEAPLAVGTPAPAGVPAPAAEPTIARAYPPLAERRILNGHVFMPSAEVPGALTTTSFGTFLILGLGKTSGSFQVAD